MTGPVSPVVSVTVDRFGAVADVAVAPDWRRRVRPRELGQVMCAAANEALATRLATDLEHVVELEAPAPVARRAARDAGGDPSSKVAQDLVDELGTLLAAFEHDLETYRRELSETAGATATGRGPRGAIEVTMGHGHVLEVTVNARWARSAGHFAIRFEACEAFGTAGRLLAASDPRAVRPPASIARLRELVGDPEALSREVGL